ncbi:hypothetical protein chiPu_0010127 [Chiloscyllium punctatum]|uniref:Uncharacterized protein n=1 Tax=Chiloscyllium punctatum TaxID=137246 RepID=A0A401SMQ7_CHIPU|nr:hypothetical protein [Chiloscyllium punctatum]
MCPSRTRVCPAMVSVPSTDPRVPSNASVPSTEPSVPSSGKCAQGRHEHAQWQQVCPAQMRVYPVTQVCPTWNGVCPAVASVSSADLGVPSNGKCVQCGPECAQWW